MHVCQRDTLLNSLNKSAATVLDLIVDNKKDWAFLIYPPGGDRLFLLMLLPVYASHIDVL